MNSQKHIFRAYDIRGIVNKDFDETWVQNLGKACGKYFLKAGYDSAVIGHDCRPSSVPFIAALGKGLSEVGVHSINIGMVATPSLYFAVKHLNKSAGIMVTASHNPPEYNGFKIWCGQTTLYGSAITEISKILAQGLEHGFEPDNHDNSADLGLSCEHNIIPSYIKAITSRVHLFRPMKVVVDGGNGSGGLILAQVLKDMGVEVVELFCEPDGNFPNHHPDPTVEKNMQDLIKKVRESGAELGIGLDGDADRLGIVDKQGRLLNGDELLAIFAKDILQKLPNSTILADVKCSDRLFKDIQSQGGKAQMVQTGHSLVKAKMLETNAPLGGELSGHIFFKHNWYGFDDAIYGAALLIDILSRTSEQLVNMPAWAKVFSTRELHLDCAEEHKFAVVKATQEHFSKKYPVIDIDGARITFAQGWGLVRASNTQPVLVLRFEALSQEALQDMQDEVKVYLDKIIKEKISLC